MPFKVAPGLQTLLLMEQKHNGMQFQKEVTGTTTQVTIQSTVQMEIYRNNN